MNPTNKSLRGKKQKRNRKFNNKERSFSQQIHSIKPQPEIKPPLEPKVNPPGGPQIEPLQPDIIPMPPFPEIRPGVFPEINPSQYL